MNSRLYHELYHKLVKDYYASKVQIKQVGAGELPYDIEIVAQNLLVPWAIAISEDGRLYFTQRSGDIRLIEDGKLLPEPVFTFQSPFQSRMESGLMGIALDPDFLQNHYMYVMHTYAESGRTFNRVVRLILQENTAYIDRVLLDRIPGGLTHDGGRIRIGPDRKLYITAGDSGNAALAQDTSSLAGKILRMELDGSIPEDNPFDNSYVYSYGLRNPQGIAWNLNHVMYASDHGQTGHDEINLILPGANYGWPIVTGSEQAGDINIKNPILQSGEDTWAPSGITYVNQGPWEGKLLVAALRGERLLALSFNEDQTEVVNVDTWLQDEYGRLREVVMAEDGSIYIATNNRDGRGNPDATDDKIIRLVPR
ncbi:MAG: glucose sorbosone dehydrogenase [Herbinix sp.]|nr:glucose sorbosone dehydrogenase [Herbinix sp.]